MRSFSVRTRLTFAALALLVTAACGGSPTAPSDSGATVAGTVSLSGGSLSTGASNAGPTGATASSGWTVSISGTGLTATIDGSGNFQISGVPSGEVQLQFSDGRTTASLTLTSVQEGQLIRLVVTISGSSVIVVNETRTSGKVELCHRNDSGSYQLISISVSAEPAHRGHGDAAVGEAVPADPTKVFSRSCQVVPVGVSIKKSTNGADADQAPGPSIAVGSPVTWQYVVTNTSTSTLTNIQVVDDRNVVVNCSGQTTLAPGASMTCTGTGTAVAGQYRNVGTVTATSPEATFSASDASHYFGEDPAEGPKVQLCHRTGNGSYHLISVSVSAEPAHRAHGDAKPGEAVPGIAGKIFTASCGLQ